MMCGRRLLFGRRDCVVNRLALSASKHTQGGRHSAGQFICSEDGRFADAISVELPERIRERARGE
jgi:hypothetical protein